MTRLLYAIFSTRGIVVAMAACAVWLARRPRSDAARRTTVWLAAAYFVASVYFFPWLVGRTLTSGYVPYQAPPEHGPAAIVVLGGGADTIVGWTDRVGTLNDSSAARALEAARVFRQMPDALVVSSGGVPPGVGDRLPEGLVMRAMLLQLGVPSSRIVVESSSRDTHDEAVIVAPMLRNRGIQLVVIVTSDIHMRRSIGTFRAVGIDAVPAIAPDPHARAPWWEWAFPSTPGLDTSAAVVHEIIGLPYYLARGWWR